MSYVMQGRYGLVGWYSNRLMPSLWEGVDGRRMGWVRGEKNVI
jgi:hypothetical protein